jgi:hypothetical protein
VNVRILEGLAQVTRSILNHGLVLISIGGGNRRIAAMAAESVYPELGVGSKQCT